MPNCRDWNAWIDRMPPGKPTLHVTSVCEFPTPGYTVELRPAEPQGINPADLLLEMHVTEPYGQVPQVVTTVEVRYEQDDSPDYDTVSIVPDGPTIPVQDVS